MRFVLPAFALAMLLLYPVLQLYAPALPWPLEGLGTLTYMGGIALLSWLLSRE
jgi:hypothetical protein